MTPAVPRCVFLIHFLLVGTYLSSVPRHVSTCSAHCSTSPSPSVTCWPPLPRHQPEPYIRRRASHASSARHICTFAAPLLFLLSVLFSFLCSPCGTLLVPRTHLCVLCLSLGYGPRSTVSLYFTPLYDLVYEYSTSYIYAARQGITLGAVS